MDIFELLRSGANVDMATPEYAEAIKHMTDCAKICFKINTTEPMPEKIRPLEEELKDVKFIQEVAMQNSGFAYMIAKRMNHLQAQRAAAFLLGEHAKFITGTDLLIDGGVIASIRTGEYKLG